MSTTELKAGLRNIESIVITNVRKIGGNITENSFVWNNLPAQDRAPEIVFAQIKANARMACIVLPREFCEASATKVTRAEVMDAIDDCVRSLAGSTRATFRSSNMADLAAAKQDIQ